MSVPAKVSFTVRRPTPASRAPSSGAESDGGTFKVPALPRHLRNGSSTPGSPLARSANASPRPASDSGDSEEEDSNQDELLTEFDSVSIERQKKRKNAPQAPLVIPTAKNKDWREVARKRRSTKQFVPKSAQARTGADGSVGGLGTRDTVNSGPQLAGLQVKTKKVIQEVSAKVHDGDDAMEVVTQVEEETEDQRALRALLAGSDGQEDGPVVDVIPVNVSEADAFKQDIEELPDSSTLEDYARVPVSQFGAALLRGMGWKEGTKFSKRGDNGTVEPYLPQARPALLGIGAKEQEVYDDGSKKNGRHSRPNKRYIPVLKQERDSRGGTPSDNKRRDRSRSPKRDDYKPSRDYDRRSHSRKHDRGSDREYDRDRECKQDHDSRDWDRDRDRNYDREPRKEKDYYKGSRDSSPNGGRHT
ncbi:hypothetical protein FISHEDRAFT_32208 [Fistulina hepatica ATCC 64428]|uniref:G-patch domain-containing protein n=1 Tax=Fistulina hepatica ATCC 64428 TaxID=1128425 RepID=A0A0D7AR20_9AGAR|nr:hypothetical protein FISHEDRAFT_32208 [Fistulina hepatica ATCC 64428]